MNVYAPFQSSKRERFRKALLAPNELWSSGERQRIVISIIESQMKDQGAEILIDAEAERWGYRPGNPVCLPDYDERYRLEAIFCGGWPFGDHTGIFWDKLPLHEIREYWGEEVAFYFAWLENYTTWLQIPAVVGIITIIIENTVWKPIVMIYSFVIIMWATLFLEYWKRCHAEIAFMWDCRDMAHIPFRERAEFGSHYLTDTKWVNPVTGVQENWTDPRARESRSTWSGVGTFFCILIAIGINGFSIFIGDMLNEDQYLGAPNGQTVGAVVLAANIAISEIIFKAFGTYLTDWQNFRFQQEYDQAFALKLFSFNFCNKFFSIFFYTFGKARYPGCIKQAETDSKFCRSEVQQQLMVLFLAELTAGQFAEVLLPLILLKINKYFDEQNEKAVLEAAGKGPKAGGAVGVDPGVGKGSGRGGAVSPRSVNLELNPIQGEKAAGEVFGKTGIAVLDADITAEEARKKKAAERIMGAEGEGSAKGLGMKMGKWQKKGDVTGRAGNVDPLELQHLMTQAAKDERLARLDALHQRQEERTFNWVQEEHEDEALKDGYWMEGGTLLDYQEMCIQFGYVTLFSMAFPLCPTLAWLNNCIEINTDSFKINATMHRPMYRVLPGIGMWADVLYFMVLQAIFVNMLMIVLYDASTEDLNVFDTSNMEMTVLVLVFAEHVIVAMKLLAERVIPDETIWLETAMEGYDYLQRQAMQDVGSQAAAQHEDLENLRTKILKHKGEAQKDVEDRFAEIGSLQSRG